MSDLRVMPMSRSVGRSTADNAGYRAVRGLRDGSLSVADFILTHALEGRLFAFNLGTATTPVTFRAGLTVLQPEIVVDVPSGTTIIPVSIDCYLEDSAGTDTEIVASTSTALRGAGTSTAGTSEAMATDQLIATACSVYYTYSANATATSNLVDFWRAGYAFADATGNPAKKFRWSIYEDVPPILVGVSSLSIYIAATGTAPAGFCCVKWIELASTAVA